MGPRCLLLLVLLTAAAATDVRPSEGSGTRPSEYTQIHMGVPVRLVAHGPDAQVQAAARAAFDRIAALDRMMSDYRPDSALSSLGEEWVRVPPELFRTIERALDVARATGGAFDPSVGPLVALWRDARRSGVLPDAAALREARGRTGWQRIDTDTSRGAVRLAPGMRLDLGGVAKGFILQDALRTLASHGIGRALLEAGGDIIVGDAPPGRNGWRIEAPGADAAFAARAARLTNAALATSGPTSQFVEIDGIRYSHVVDPRSGRALTSSRIVHVIGPDGATADALATAMAVLGSAAIRQTRVRFPEVLISVVEPAQP